MGTAILCLHFGIVLNLCGHVKPHWPILAAQGSVELPVAYQSSKTCENGKFEADELKVNTTYIYVLLSVAHSDKTSSDMFWSFWPLFDRFSTKNPAWAWLPSEEVSSSGKWSKAARIQESPEISRNHMSFWMILDAFGWFYGHVWWFDGHLMDLFHFPNKIPERFHALSMAPPGTNPWPSGPRDNVLASATMKQKWHTYVEGLEIIIYQVYFTLLYNI